MWHEAAGAARSLSHKLETQLRSSCVTQMPSLLLLASICSLSLSLSLRLPLPPSPSNLYGSHYIPHIPPIPPIPRIPHIPHIPHGSVDLHALLEAIPRTSSTHILDSLFLRLSNTPPGTDACRRQRRYHSGLWTWWIVRCVPMFWCCCLFSPKFDPDKTSNNLEEGKHTWPCRCTHA